MLLIGHSFFEIERKAYSKENVNEPSWTEKSHSYSPLERIQRCILPKSTQVYYLLIAIEFHVQCMEVVAYLVREMTKIHNCVEQIKSSIALFY